MAVLYFENLSGAKEDEYFRDGMTEDVITELSKVKELRVFPRAAVVAFRDQSVTGPQVGQQLERPVRPRRLAAPRRQPPPHHGAARRGAHRHVRLGRALRPRAVGRLRGAGRDRAEHHPGPADHAHPAGGEAAGRQAHRRPARLRPLPEGARLLPPHDAVRPRPRPADVRARDPARPRLRPRPRRDRERLRARLRVAREGRALARPRPRLLRAGPRPRPGPARRRSWAAPASSTRRSGTTRRSATCGARSR